MTFFPIKCKLNVKGGNMAGNKIVQIVASQSSPAKEDEYNRWYSEVHLPMLFGFEGVKRASRYKLIGDNPVHNRFLAIYEFETREDMDAFTKSPAFAAAIEDFENRKDDLGFEMKWAASYELISTLSR
jgi:heme-degrading monooxygenase HmoA